MANVDIQEPIRTVYKDGTVVISNVRNKLNNSNVNYSVVTTWYDGTAMNDSKIDQWGVYTKYKPTGEYIRQVLPNWGELFVEVDTVARLRSLSEYNLFLLQIGYYKGVKLNGYYTKGDTPAPIEYYLSDTDDDDDGNKIIRVEDIALVSNITEYYNYPRSEERRVGKECRCR